MSAAFKPTDEQQRIISLNEGSYLVVAPPGSGKTQVLTQRIVRLLLESSGQRFRILALTFTTKAAENMVTRIEAEAAEQWRRVTAKTFHSFCLDVLQHYGEAVGVASGFTVYENEDDRIEALARGLSDEGLTLNRNDEELKSLRRLLAEIGRFKRDLVPPGAVPGRDTKELAEGRVAYTAYDRTLRLFNAVDYDDLLGLAYKLFTEHPRVARHYRRLFPYVLVDEAQDTSRAQYEILRSLCGDEHRNVMLVADGNQLIHRYAGASVQFLQAFKDDFGAKEVPLHLNFRCAEDIVSAANVLISHNANMLKAHDPKVDGVREAMQSEAKAKGLVTATSYANEEEEARGVVDLVQTMTRDGLDPRWLNATEDPAVKPESISILARNRVQLRDTLKEMDRREIPYAFATAEQGLLDSALFKAAYYALRSASNPKDLLSRRNLLGVLDVGPDDHNDLLNQPIAEFLAAAGHLNSDSPGALLEVLASAWSPGMNEDSFLRAVLEEAARLATSSTPEDLRAVEEADLAIFKARLASHRRQAEDGAGSIHGFLGELSLVKRTAQEVPGIRVLTIHAAKGLEFTAVVLIGLNEGSFPDFRSKSSAEIEDERRNAYVAVTRAARRLHLTRPRMRTMPWGAEKPQTVSRFVGELNLTMKDE